MGTVFLGAFLIVYLILIFVSLAVGILDIISYWKLFEKAGEPGWKSLIPFYNLFVITKIATGGYTAATWIAVLTALYYILLILVSITESVILTLIAFLALIPVVVLSCYIYYQFGKAYRKSTGWCVAMIFLNQILIIAMGFDKDVVYTGPVSKNTELY